MPHFLRHYEQFADRIYIYDNGSTDSTLDIIRRCPIAQVKHYETGNKIREDVYLVIKNHCWKKSTADYVIIADIDEFVYHPNIIDYLKEHQQTDVFEPAFYHMVTNHIPQPHETLMKFEKGFLSKTNKMNVFKPQIEQINYGAGCHKARPTTTNILYCTELKTLHYKFLTPKHMIDKYKKYKPRVHGINLLHGWNYHYLWSEQKIIDCFTEAKNKASDVFSRQWPKYL